MALGIAALLDAHRRFGLLPPPSSVILFDQAFSTILHRFSSCQYFTSHSNKQDGGIKMERKAFDEVEDMRFQSEFVRNQ